MAPKFQIVEKSVRSDDEFISALPNPTEYAAQHPDTAAGTKADFGDNIIYVLKAPVGWRWERQRGRVVGSKNGQNGTTATEAPENDANESESS